MANRSTANRNPALREKIFDQPQPLAVGVERMSIEGVARKALILLVVVFATATYPWGKVLNGEDVTGLFWIGTIGGLVLAFATIFRPGWASFTAPLYAAAEGLALGAISGWFEAAFPGIAMQAVLGTMGVFVVMLALYMSRTLRATPKFRRGVIGATFSVLLIYLASFVLGVFGVEMPFLHDTGPVGIIITLVIIGIAALNLILDFDFIERGARGGAPQMLEWYGAFGLLVTLVWLYLQILRLMALLNRR